MTVDNNPARPERKLLYRSANGDGWFLERPLNGLPMVVHEANQASGGKVTRTPAAEFLDFGNGPEQQALRAALEDTGLDVKRPTEDDT